MATADGMAHLTHELRLSDPWRLESNPFERQRHAEILRVTDGDAPFEAGFEVGCAAGALTAQLTRRCRSLRVIDLLPEAIERCRTRVGCDDVDYSVADVA